jgi:hypothetical protein
MESFSSLYRDIELRRLLRWGRLVHPKAWVIPHVYDDKRHLQNWVLLHPCSEKHHTHFKGLYLGGRTGYKCTQIVDQAEPRYIFGEVYQELTH